MASCAEPPEAALACARGGGPEAPILVRAKRSWAATLSPSRGMRWDDFARGRREELPRARALGLDALPVWAMAGAQKSCLPGEGKVGIFAAAKMRLPDWEDRRQSNTLSSQRLSQRRHVAKRASAFRATCPFWKQFWFVCGLAFWRMWWMPSLLRCHLARSHHGLASSATGTIT